MQKRNKPRWNKQTIQDCLLCAGTALLIAMLFASGILNERKVWPDVQMEHRREDASYSLEQGDQYGVVATGPYYDLDRGTYRLRWQINGDGANLIRFCNSTGGEILPSQVYTQPGEWQGEAYFEIKEPVHNFHLSIEFTEGTWMEIYNLRLYTPEYTDGAWGAAFVLSALVGLWILSRHGKINTERKEAICVLGLAVLLMTLPALHENSITGSDVAFHAARLMNLADGLRGGQFPVRAGGFSYNGYGAVTSVFYPDLLLYPFAIMIIGGASPVFVMNMVRVIITVVAAMTMYAAAKGMFRNHTHALCSAILYVSAPCFLGNMWGFALGQMLAFSFFPLLVWGIWEVIWGDKKRWTVLVLAATLIFQSHMLSVLLWVLAACVVGIINLPRIVKEKRFGTIVKAIIVTLLMNLVTIIPMLTSYLSGINSMPIQFGFAESAVPIRTLLRADEMMGFPILLGCMCTIAYAEREEKEWKMARGMGIAGGISALLCTSLIPWSYIVLLTNELITILQFPWRFISLAIPTLCLCAGYGYEILFKGKRIHTPIIALVIAVAFAWPEVESAINRDVYLEFGMGVNPYMSTPEYQIEGTEVGDTRDQEAHLFDDVQLTAYEKTGTEITAEVSSADGGAIEFPLFAFDGYKAELDGREIVITRGDNNRIRVEIPAGTSGPLHIWFAGKLLWRVADAVSLTTAAALCAYVIRKRKNEFAG